MKKTIVSILAMSVILLYSTTLALAADISYWESNIKIGTIYSSTYDVNWDALTEADTVASKVTVVSAVYFNGVKKGTSENLTKYNSKSVKQDGTKSGSQSMNGEWEIFSEHYVDDKPKQWSYDNQYWFK